MSMKWFKILGIVTGMVAGLGTITPASGFVDVFTSGLVRARAPGEGEILVRYRETVTAQQVGDQTDAPQNDSQDDQAADTGEHARPAARLWRHWKSWLPSTAPRERTSLPSSTTRATRPAC